MDGADHGRGAGCLFGDEATIDLRPGGAARMRWENGLPEEESLELMTMLVAIGVMSITWMAVIVVLVLAQKLLPVKTAIDLPLSLAVAGLGVMIVIAPSLVPRLSPPM